MRISAPFLVAAAAIVAMPVAAETLADVERAMSLTDTMHATFTQVAPSGATTGQMVMKRPGRIRFDYDGNKDYLVVADGRLLSFVDYRVRQVSQWPLSETPLGVLLNPKAELGRIAKVLPDKDSPLPGHVAVEAKDPKRPEQGQIIFFLKRETSAPGGLKLTGWRVTDSQGNLTTVTLSGIKLNQSVANSMFSFKDPRPRTTPPGRPG